MPVRVGLLPGRLVNILRSVSGRDVLLILAATPIVFLFVIAPQTFELSWAGFGQLGRGGLFIILFFLGLDLLDFEKGKIHWTMRRKLEAAIIVVIGVFYFVEVGVSQAGYSPGTVDALALGLNQGHIDFGLIFEGGLTNFIYALGRVLGASGDYSNSFLMATDFIADTIYIALLSIILFTASALRRIVTPLLFGLGMLFFYLLDAFLPYGSIGPLQFWANFIVAGVAFLAMVFGLPIYGFTNHLTIVGLHGYFGLVVYWPSVGVQSVLIYSVVMVVIAAKLQAPRIRKIIYAVVGVVVTVLLNVVRVFSIAYYGYAYATSGQQLDAFHNTVGEVLFLFWIVAYLFLIIEIENRLTRPRRVPRKRKKSVPKRIRVRKLAK
jgi:thaumarchaeosortase